MKEPAWSYSSLSQFETCPAQYAAQRVYKTIKFKENEASIWGNEVHAAIEKGLRTGEPLPERFKQYEATVHTIKGAGGDHFYEEEMALNRHLKPVTWFAKNVWVRGIIDVLIVNGEQAVAIDWKTGKIKNDPTQLKLFALLVFAHFPHVEVVTSSFEWLKFNASSSDVWEKKDLEFMWAELLTRYDALNEAHRLDIWTPKPSGLCKMYCDHKECEFHGVGNRR